MKKVFKTILIVLVAILVISCDLFKSQDNRKVIVRVNNSYLYEEDINSLVGEGISAEDSAIIVNSYINRWATQQLLIDRAKLNLPEARQKEFNELVENYKNELYTNAYTEAIVSKEMDSVFADTLISNYYEEHKENFKLGQDLVKLRYINLEANNTNFDKIKDWFIRFNDKDKVKLQENALQFKNYSFNDSVWIKTTTVYEKVTPLSVGDRAKLLQKDKYIELKDSLELCGENIFGLAYCVGSIDIKSISAAHTNDYIDSFKINTIGAITAIKSTKDILLKNNGSILLFSSVAAKQGFTNHTIISTAKGAIEGLTVSLAAELSPNVRVNCIAPSLTESGMSKPIISNENIKKAIESLHAIPKIGQPNDHSKLAAFLLSESNNWITGQIFNVDGGRSTVRKKG